MKNLISRFFKAICLLLVGFLILPLTACVNKWQTVSTSKFNTVITITVKNYHLKESQTLNSIYDFLDDLDSAVSTSKYGSDVYTFNNADKDQPIEFSDTALFLLQSAIAFNKTTSSKFNPALYPLNDLWQFTPDKYGFFFTLPTEEKINEVKALINLDLLTIDQTLKTVSKSNEKVKIDLGGVAKGYATDKISEILKKVNIKEGYISMGGSSIYVFSVPDYLGITHPRNRGDEIIRVLPHVVKNKSISTSGDYQRFYTQNGIRYSHIIDPETGAPANTGFSSVTVIGDNGTQLDMLSTALNCFTFEQMKAFIESTDLSIFAVYETDKQILTNKKQGEDFTLLDSEYTIVEL